MEDEMVVSSGVCPWEGLVYYIEDSGTNTRGYIRR